MAGPRGVDLTGQIHKNEIYPRGYGAFTDVYVGEWRRVGASQTMIPVAIKMFRGVQNDQRTLEDITRRLIRESRVWSTLDHSHILPYFGYCTAIGPSTALISPFCVRGTVVDYLLRHPDANRMKFTVEVASGMDYLHRRGIVHGDLHGKNVLIDDGGGARLADFGRAKVIGDEGYSTRLVAGAVEWMAPELFPRDDSEDDDDEAPPFTSMSDVYAFSMLAFQIFTDRTPFQRGSNPLSNRHVAKVILQICRGVRPDRAHDTYRRIPDFVWDIMERCWVANPRQRPSAAVISTQLGTGGRRRSDVR